MTAKIIVFALVSFFHDLFTKGTLEFSTVARQRRVGCDRVVYQRPRGGARQANLWRIKKEKK